MIWTNFSGYGQLYFYFFVTIEYFSFLVFDEYTFNEEESFVSIP